MKRIKPTLIALVVALLLSSCYGPFKLTRNLHDWNGSLGDEWVNSLVFYGLLVVPVYEVAAAIDVLILNTIEFWTGDNPVGFKGNKKMEKIVEQENSTYKITAKRNTILIEGISGIDQGKKIKMKIDKENKQLFLEKEGELIKLAEFDEIAQTVKVFQPDGSFTEIDPSTTDPLAYIQNN